jgi:hypothetical protein
VSTPKHNKRQETETVTFPTPGTDPFADPAATSVRPSIGSLRGRLVMITPRKIETVASNMNPGQTEDRMTADVSVVDGLGPVPQMKNNVPTGAFLDGPDFTGVWISSTRVVDQCRPFVGTGKPVLGVIETWKPGQQPIKGNPWGIVTATPEQRAQAVNFLNSRAIGATAQPAPQPQAALYTQQAPQGAPMAPVQQPAPVYGHAPAAAAPNPFAAVPTAAAAPQQGAPVVAPAAPVPAQATPTAPAVPAPGSAPAGVNPFAQ